MKDQHRKKPASKAKIKRVSDAFRAGIAEVDASVMVDLLSIIFLRQSFGNRCRRRGQRA
jgi:hypothetical protein